MRSYVGFSLYLGSLRGPKTSLLTSSSNFMTTEFICVDPVLLRMENRNTSGTFHSPGLTLLFLSDLIRIPSVNFGTVVYKFSEVTLLTLCASNILLWAWKGRGTTCHVQLPLDKENQPQGTSCQPRFSEWTFLIENNCKASIVSTFREYV